MRQQPTQQLPQWSQQELLTTQQYQPVQSQPVSGRSQAPSQQRPQPGTAAAQQGWASAQSAAQQPAQTGQQVGVSGAAAQQPAQTGQQVGASGAAAQPGSMGQSMAQTGPAQVQAREPPVDVLETPDALVVLVDLAGFDQDDIQLDVDNDVLRIAAGRTLEIDDEESLLAQERPTRFERYLQLPVEANIEEASATHENGVCRITLPKSEQARESHHRIGFQ